MNRIPIYWLSCGGSSLFSALPRMPLLADQQRVRPACAWAQSRVISSKIKPLAQDAHCGAAFVREHSQNSLQEERSGTLVVCPLFGHATAGPR